MIFHTWQRPLLPILIALFGLLCLMHLPVAASPTTSHFTVNTTADGDDANTGDGICDADALTAGEQCTLRAAISQANAKLGADQIMIPAGLYTLAITGTLEDSNASGDLDITGDLTIVGVGAATTIIQAGPDAASGVDRVFHIAANGIQVSISDLTIQHGHIPGGLDPGIYDDGGGILNDKTAVLTLIHTIVRDNLVEDFGEDGGGIANIGGGIVNVYSSTIRDNRIPVSFGSGGGLFNVFGSRMLVVNSVISGNQAGFYGGGVYNHRDFATVTLISNTIQGNSSDSGGGGVYNGEIMTIRNSTISGNRAALGGGGLFSSDRNGVLTVTHVTIADNIADSENSGSYGGGGIWHELGTAVIQNSLIANNQLGDGREDDCGSDGTLFSASYTLIETANCAFTNTQTLTGLDPQLQSFWHGAYPLTLTSPVIDQIPATHCPDTIDQTGTTRPQGVHCDMGAVEYVGTGTAVSPTLMITPTTLSWLANDANCAFAVYSSTTPYGGYSLLVNGTVSLNYVISSGGTAFYEVAAYACGNLNTAVSNHVGQFVFALAPNT